MILGIDPGLSGAAAVLRPDGSVFYLTPYSKTTPHDLVVALGEPGITKAYIESVHSMPAQGVASTFKFGENYGLWQGILTAIGIPFERVYPLKWQTALGCKTGGNKNISKARAQELFPKVKVTHAIADALLIAEYGRRQEQKIISADL
jgi:hypothetical protein